jgi:CBS domain-containing protein
MPYQPNDEFKKLAEEIKASGKAEEVSVRKLLRYFHQARRSFQVVWWIRHQLKRHGLECIPDFENVFIDSRVELRKLPMVPVKKTNKTDEADVPSDGAVDRDPVPRLSLLPSANRVPVSVGRETGLDRAITTMMMPDFSQLPVMHGEREVHGMVSWRSIVVARSVGCACQTVGECMVKDIAVLPFDTPLFDAVKIVMSREAVLVQGIDKKIVGLVTIADIGEQFVTLAEPFLILEQIENHIRTLLDGKFTKDQLEEALDSSVDGRKVDAISDLTFGEYIRLLEKPDNWKSLKLSMDRATFVKRLDDVRRIRNDVMHFHPDGISEEDVARLRETAKFFYVISQFRVG